MARCTISTASSYYPAKSRVAPLRSGLTLLSSCIHAIYRCFIRTFGCGIALFPADFLSTIGSETEEGFIAMSNFFRIPFFAAAFLILAVPGIAGAQAAAPAPAAAPTAGTPEPFVLPNLGLTYTPPAGWQPQDVAKLKAAGDPASAKCNALLYAVLQRGGGGLSRLERGSDAVRSVPHLRATGYASGRPDEVDR